MSDAAEEVILVDPEDRQVGVASKLEVHRNGDLHRAFSVLIHDGNGKVLLQKRHKAKYHSGGLWSNTCCGHPRPGEDAKSAAARRLGEEMGVACTLTPLGTLQYRADVGGGLIEHELVHLHCGIYEGPVSPDRREAELYAWKTLAEIEAEAATAPERFTAWFCLYVQKRWPLRMPRPEMGSRG
jgi:isopentenyl-diphosphate delta-isomerase